MLKSLYSSTTYSTSDAVGDPPDHKLRRRPDQDLLESNLLVEGLGVGGGGRNVGIAGSLVGAGGELELVGRLEVGVTGLAVGSGVVLEVEKLGNHLGGGDR
jgi:hypothetical protein